VCTACRSLPDLGAQWRYVMARHTYIYNIIYVCMYMYILYIYIQNYGSRCSRLSFPAYHVYNEYVNVHTYICVCVLNTYQVCIYVRVVVCKTSVQLHASAGHRNLLNHPYS
jgi:hypothetical protein